MHDLEAVAEDGRRIAIEVTDAVDADATELWNIVNGRGRWSEPHLAGGWAVHVRPDARHLRRDLPRFLQTLEYEGIHAFSANASPSRGIAAPAGVLSARQSDTDFPGSVYIFLKLPPDQVSGFAAATGDELATWLSEFLAHDRRADVRRKLARSGADERHAFVVVSGLPGVRFGVTDLLLRNDAPLPTIAPDLPVEVTDVWAASTWASGVGFRWSSRRQSWAIFDKTREEAPR